jgi:hypothetical protein
MQRRNILPARLETFEDVKFRAPLFPQSVTTSYGIKRRTQHALFHKATLSLLFRSHFTIKYFHFQFPPKLRRNHNESTLYGQFPLSQVLDFASRRVRSGRPFHRYLHAIYTCTHTWELSSFLEACDRPMTPQKTFTDANVSPLYAEIQMADAS